MTEVNIPPPPFTPPTLPQVDTGAVTKAVSDISGAFTGAVTETIKAFGGVIEHVGQLDDTAIARLTALKGLVDGLLSNASKETKEVIAELIKLVEAAPKLPTPPPPVDVPQACQEIAKGISHAAEILYNGMENGKTGRVGGGMIIATGSVNVDIQVKMPGGGPGAAARISLQISQKPYN